MFIFKFCIKVIKMDLPLHAASKEANIQGTYSHMNGFFDVSQKSKQCNK